MLKRFITFEGGEGVGKTTQIKRLAEALRARGDEVMMTREPGGSPGAEAIRHVLLSGAARAIGSDLEVLLFAAARADHVEETIRPALARGAWVLCDRFIDSTRVYQGLNEVDPTLIAELELMATDGLMPSLTLILDMPATKSVERIKERAAETAELDLDHFELEPIAVHRRRRSAFLAISKAEPARCVVISANADPDMVAERIFEAVRNRFDLDEESGGGSPEAKSQPAAESLAS